MMDYTLPTPPPKSVFRNASNTRYLKGLFYETSSDREFVVYSLKDSDHLGYPSLYQIYLHMGDPEEFTFASTYLADYEHWEMLCSAGWFQPYMKKFRKHLDKKLKSEALARIIQEGRSGGKSAFTANRFVVEKGWASSSRGRPSSTEIAQTAFEIASTDKRLLEDMHRILPRTEVLNG